MSTVIETAVARIAPIINEKVSDLLATDPSARDSRMKSTVDEILALLTKNNLAYKAKFNNQHVGVHKDNRFGDGLNPQDVHDLLQMIVTQGWSWGEVSRACAVEVQPGDNEHLMFNEKVAEASNGMLAECIREDIKIVSLSCSHTVAALRCVLAECRSGSESSITKDGVISKQLVLDRSPEMQSALDEGLSWFVIRWQVDKACPDLGLLIQEALNLQHQTARQQSKIQVLLQLHSRAMKSMAVGGTIDWDAVAAAVGKLKPSLRDSLGDMAKYCERWSGGTDPVFLRELEDYTKATPGSKRDLQGAFFGMLAKIGSARHGEYVNAMVKASLSAPDRFVQDGVARLFTSTDINSVTGKNKDQVEIAVTMMRRARELADEFGAKGTLRTKILSDLDIRLVMYIHSKTAVGRRVYKSMQEIGVCCYDEFQEHFSNDKVVSPWASKHTAAPSQQVKTKSAPVAKPQLREFSSSGQLKAASLSSYTEGTRVSNKEGLTYEIVTVLEAEFVLQPIEPVIGKPDDKKCKGKTSQAEAKSIQIIVPAAVMHDDYKIEAHEMSEAEPVFLSVVNDPQRQTMLRSSSTRPFTRTLCFSVTSIGTSRLRRSLSRSSRRNRFSALKLTLLAH